MRILRAYRQRAKSTPSQAETMSALATTSLLVIVLMLSACSAKDHPAGRGDNVWGNQVRSYDHAHAVQGQLHDAAKTERKNIDQQTQ